MISLCQNCNWSSHTAPESRTRHKRQTINCYSGCPSAAELSRIWSFFSVDFSSSNPQEGSSSLEKEDKNLSRHPLSPFDHTEEAAMDPMASDIDQFCGSGSSDPLNEKASSARIRYFGSLHDEILHEDFNNSDIDLSLDNFGVLFVKSFDEAQQFLENGGIDSLFEIVNVLDTEFDAESIPVAKHQHHLLSHFLFRVIPMRVALDITKNVWCHQCYQRRGIHLISLVLKISSWQLHGIVQCSLAI